MARIVVCGAGVCGLTTAMLLARDGHEVTVLERDPEAPPAPGEAWDAWTRRGVGQFRLPHFLLGGFRQVIQRELPELEQALVDGGALRLNVLGPFAEALDPEDRNVVITARRPLVEAIVAGVAGSWPGLTVRRGVAIGGVVTEDGAAGGRAPHVVGVRTEDGEEVRADLVVDALGRRSPMARWLAEAGAASPEVEEEVSGFVYYGRHVRTPDGSVLGPTLAFYGSVGLLLLPAEGGISGVGIIAWSGDAELRALRHDGPWRAVLGLLPDGPAILAAEQIESDIAVMAGIEDRIRRYVVDGEPVATGVLSVADAWAATNPTLGRGISLGARHACLLRDAVREVGTEDAEGLVRRFDEVTQAQQAPWYRSTVWHDRHRIADFQAAIDGRERTPDPEWERFLAFTDAAFGDLELLPHFLDTFRLDRRPDEILADPAVIAHLEEKGLAPTTTGPSREEVLAAVASAS
jgi:2-polyprenyl-6-methoxyphenol hydroxylase-like FAD-dependent oxidoreductase